MKKVLAKALVISIIAVSSAPIYAATLVASSATGATASGISGGPVTSAVTLRLSKDVSLVYDLGTTVSAAAAKHKQSTNSFGGNTSGGQIDKCNTSGTKGSDISNTIPTGCPAAS